MFEALRIFRRIKVLAARVEALERSREIDAKTIQGIRESQAQMVAVISKLPGGHYELTKERRSRAGQRVNVGTVGHVDHG